MTTTAPAEDDSISPTLLSIIEERIAEEGWDEEARLAITNETFIWFSDGQLANYWAEEEHLWNVVFDIDIEAEGKMIKIDGVCGSFESFYPRERIAAISMPLLRVMDAAKRGMDDIQIDLTDKDKPLSRDTSAARSVRSKPANGKAR